MKKALSRNPNMLRTMIGMGLVLILVLSYAVYSNTVDSEYYRYETTNESVTYSYDLIQTDLNNSEWFVHTDSAITWINVTVHNAPVGSVLVVTSTSSIWHYSELLGQEGDAAFNCKEFDEISESCEAGYSHSMVISEPTEVLRGRASLNLPIEGAGYLTATNQSEAESASMQLIEDETVLTTWFITIVEDGEPVSPDGIGVSLTVVEHELVSVSEFELDPIQETVYATATLIGCFSLLIAVPMIAYFAGVAKAKLDEENRSEDPAPTN